ncbi:MAG: hypothetical protein ABI610_01730 [Acidobacteriota bacterium]
MNTNGKRWRQSMAAGILGSFLLAGAAFGAESRMAAQRRATSVRPAQAERSRVVDFKPERTDSWLCENVSPFFCAYVPTVAASQPATTSTRQRGRN